MATWQYLKRSINFWLRCHGVHREHSLKSMYTLKKTDHSKLNYTKINSWRITCSLVIMIVQRQWILTARTFIYHQNLLDSVRNCASVVQRKSVYVLLKAIQVSSIVTSDPGRANFLDVPTERKEELSLMHTQEYTRPDGVGIAATVPMYIWKLHFQGSNKL